IMSPRPFAARRARAEAQRARPGGMNATSVGSQWGRGQTYRQRDVCEGLTVAGPIHPAVGQTRHCTRHAVGMFLRAVVSLEKQRQMRAAADDLTVSVNRISRNLKLPSDKKVEEQGGCHERTNTRKTDRETRAASTPREGFVVGSPRYGDI